MPSTVTVNFLTTQHKASTGVTAAFPDVCKTPAPPAPSPVPIPYPNVGNSSMASSKVTKRVGDDTQKVVVKSSEYAMTSGDEAGVAMGVVSNKIKGKSKVMNQSVNVKFEGKGIGRLSDPHGNNAGGQLNAANPACAQPPNAGGEATATEPDDPCEELEKNNKVKAEGGKTKKQMQDETAEKNGMDKDDADAMRKHCGDKGVSATFRSGNKDQVAHVNGTGPHCVDGEPLPGKPIEIKDKSIDLSKRPETVKYPGGGVDEALSKKVSENKLDGLVGVYDKHGTLRGVRNTNGVQPLDSIPPVNRTPYTGDYDGHEFFGKDGKRITGKTDEENDMINDLNSSMGRDGSKSRPNMVMHGPQANYTEYCKATGKTPNPDLQVSDLSKKPPEPLIAFKDGEMYELKTEKDLDNFYKCQGAEPPPEWD